MQLFVSMCSLALPPKVSLSMYTFCPFNHSTSDPLPLYPIHKLNDVIKLVINVLLLLDLGWSKKVQHSRDWSCIVAYLIRLLHYCQFGGQMIYGNSKILQSILFENQWRERWWFIIVYGAPKWLKGAPNFYKVIFAKTNEKQTRW